MRRDESHDLSDYRDEAVLQAVGELRADFRQMREMDQDDHHAMMEQIHKIGEKVDRHERYWSITLFVGRIFGWIVGLGGLIAGWLNLRS